MDVYMTEDEQIEKIKQLWQRYGSLLLTLLLAAVTMVAAYHWWQQRTLSISSQASDVYMQLLNSDASHDVRGVQAMANTLISTYQNTPYASQAALMLAKIAAAESKLDIAKDHLQWVIDNSRIISVKQIARLRYAYILLAQNKAQEALSELDTTDDPTFKPLIASLRGDIYRKQLDIGKARLSYEEALGSLPKETLTSAVVQMKLDNLVVSRSQNGANA